jgi:hypothetical protein
MSRPVAIGPCLAVVLTLCGPVAADAEQYALVVTGASGGDVYARKYDLWRDSLVATLKKTFSYPDDHLIVLAEQEGPGVTRATDANVRAALNRLARRASSDDVLLVMLMGHGTGYDGEDAKFNLIGPDLSAVQWAKLVAPIKARVVFVASSGSSFPFLQTLAARGRIVVSATDSPAQRFDTVFPEFFVRALSAPEADTDKNGRVSVWEAFVYASSAVRQWFEERGQLATERPVLDDNGDGEGSEPDGAKGDGSVARTTYLQAATPGLAESAEMAELVRQRAEVEAKIDALRGSKDRMTPELFERQLETLLLELARLDRQIRDKR